MPRPEASAGFGMSFADQLCDTRLLSAAMVWAADNFIGGTGDVSPQCQIYNIDNGDVVSWDVSCLHFCGTVLWKPSALARDY